MSRSTQPHTSWIRTIDANLERWLLLGFYTFVVVTVAAEVCRRFLLSHSSIWGEEAARYAFIYLAWIGAAFGVRNRSHIRIDFLFNALPSRWQGFMNIIGHIATLTLAVVAIYWSLHGIAVSIKYGSVTHGLRINLAWFMAAIPLAFSLITVRLFQAMHYDWRVMRGQVQAARGGTLFD